MARPTLAQSNIWVRFKARWKRSGTVMLGLAETGVSATTEGVKAIAGVVTDPSFKSALNAVSPPTYVMSIIGILGLITIAVRLRGGSPDPL